MPSHLSPAKLAGLLLAARPYFDRAGAPALRVATILAATGVGKSRAYVERARVLRALTADARAPGSELGALTHRMLRFLMHHPGAVRRANRRRSYSNAFRHFVILLRRQYHEIPLLAFARAVDVPLPTLRDWLHHPAGRALRLCSALEHAVPAREPREPQRGAEEAWRHRQSITPVGPMRDACNEQAWAHAPGAAGAGKAPSRLPRARPRIRRRHEQAMRGSFMTFFPGAQWVSDGTTLKVQVNDQRYDFNLQLTVDTHTAALVGASIRDHEDCEGVIESFRNATQTTGAPPLFLLLDNRPCNHAARLAGAMQGTRLMYARKGRPQNKAHVEGAFGLFAQQVPPIHIDATDPRALARQVLELVVMTWARTLNHRPRRDRRDHSRVELYRSAHLAAEVPAATVHAAREHLERRMRRPSSDHPSHPAVVADALARLELGDSRSRLVRAIERCPLDAILGGVATYEAKRAARTLPAFGDREAAGRYLLRIVENITEEDEGMRIAEALLRRRRELHARLIRSLEKRHAALAWDTSPEVLLVAVIHQALRTDNEVERRFWLDASAKTIRSAAAGQAETEAALYRQAVQAILSDAELPYRRRLAIVRGLATFLVPLT